jgi:RNA polymerase sigma factor (sigma-70 family)
MAPLLRRQTTDAAFERLYRRHVKDVYRYAFAVLGERSDAEDVTQTTFLNAYRAFQRGEQPQKPQNWLIAIAHNVCRQRFRQSQRRPREVEFDDAIGGAAVEEPQGPSVEDLRRAFSQLPPNQRAALVMRELEGRSYSEIAGVLEISVSALETLLFRARRALREQLEGQLTCSEAAFAVSKQADGRLSQSEQRALRAHLRACPECARAASRQRAQRRALKTMLAVPLPQSLGSFFGGGAAVGAASTTAVAAGGAGIVFKAAAVLTAGVVVGGGAYVGVEQRPLIHRGHPAAVAPKAVPAAPRATAVQVSASRLRPARAAAAPRAPLRKPHATPVPGVSQRPDKPGEQAVGPARRDEQQARRAQKQEQKAERRPAQQAHKPPRAEGAQRADTAQRADRAQRARTASKHATPPQAGQKLAQPAQGKRAGDRSTAVRRNDDGPAEKGKHGALPAAASALGALKGHLHPDRSSAEKTAGNRNKAGTRGGADPLAAGDLVAP